MTYNELKSQVIRLGFDETVDDEELLAAAAGRALSLMFLDIPRLATARICVTAPVLTKVYKTVKHRGGQTEELELMGSAFSFLPHGEGAYTLIDGDEVGRVEFNGDCGYVKGKIESGLATLRFEGDGDFTVTTLATFDGVYATEDVIPEYTTHKLIDLATRLGDYRTLASPPRYPEGGTVTEAEPFGESLRLPFSFAGEIIIDYYRTPRRIERGNAILDLPSGAEELMPLLVASFLWLDDEPEKAQYYMALYRDAAAGFTRAARHESKRKYVTNGWA